MSPTTKRPIYLNPLQFRLPLTGWVSIGHRISGVLLVLTIPWAAQLLAQSLSGPEGFAAAAAALKSIPVHLLLFLLLWALLHHLFGGIRFLLMDLDLGVDKITARSSASLVLAGAAAAAVLVTAGMWL